MENIWVNNEDRLYFEHCKSDTCDAIKEMLIPFLHVYLFTLHIQSLRLAADTTYVHIWNTIPIVTHRCDTIRLLEY